MALTAKKPEGEDYPILPEGVKLAVCIGLYDLGTQYQKKWDKEIHKVLIVWELPEERIEIEKDGEAKDLPRAISKRYTLSLHEKAQLRKDLEAWRGKKFTADELEGFDLQNILGKSCQIQVIHNEVDNKTYANIAAIMALPKSVQPLQPENKPKMFSWEDDSDIPDGTPPWIVDIIKESKEYKTVHGEPIPTEDSDLEPF